MKSVVMAFSLFCLVQGSGVSTQTGTNCDPTLKGYTVTTFDVTPWPPYRNTDLVLAMTGTINQATTLQDMMIQVKYDGLNFYHESIPESGTYAAGQTATINFKVFLPSVAPSGKYAVQVRLQDNNANYLNCWQVNFIL
jgi:hypothetical protein